jgi:hypothetical protein
MRGHLRDDQWIDLAATGGTPDERRHLEGCGRCRETLADVSQGWDLAHEADVPEPSPLYWESFRRGVGQRISQERAPRARWGSLGFRWAVAATMFVTVSLSLLALKGQVGLERSAPSAALPAWSPVLSTEADPGLSVLAALDSGDLAHASCGDVALCLADVSEEEGERISQGLEKEMKGRSL